MWRAVLKEPPGEPVYLDRANAVLSYTGLAQVLMRDTKGDEGMKEEYVDQGTLAPYVVWDVWVEDVCVAHVAGTPDDIPAYRRPTAIFREVGPYLAERFDGALRSGDLEAAYRGLEDMRAYANALAAGPGHYIFLAAFADMEKQYLLSCGQFRAIATPELLIAARKAVAERPYRDQFVNEVDFLARCLIHVYQRPEFRLAVATSAGKTEVSPAEIIEALRLLRRIRAGAVKGDEGSLLATVDDVGVPENLGWVAAGVRGEAESIARQFDELSRRRAEAMQSLDGR